MGMSQAEFWADDAAALRNREDARALEARTGLRMPEAAPKVSQELKGSHATASADWSRLADVPKRRAKQSPGRTAFLITAGILAAATMSVAVDFLLALAVFKTQDVITRAEFESLKPGMSMDEATQIVGVKGTENIQTDTFGRSLTVVSWQNIGGTVATASFTDGKLQSKFQVGL
jgi:hypothetical protein